MDYWTVVPESLPFVSLESISVVLENLVQNTDADTRLEWDRHGFFEIHKCSLMFRQDDETEERERERERNTGGVK
jgi:hypothetical protein